MGSSIGSSLANVTFTSTSSSATSSGIDTTGANAIFAFVYGAAALNGGTPFSDNKGNTWTLIAGPGSTFGLTEPCLNVYGCLNPTVGSGHTFSIIANGFAGICVDARAGVLSLTYDINDFQQGMPSPVSFGPDTPGFDGELVYLFGGPSVDQSLSSPTGTEFASWDLASTDGIGGSYYGVYLASHVQGTATAISTGFSATGPNLIIGYLVSFKPTSFTGGASIKHRLTCLGVG